MSYLIDINVWLALSWRLHPHSGTAHQWFATLPKSKIGILFCRITQLGLLRLLANEQVMGGSVLTVNGAFSIFDRWCEDPRVEMAVESKSLESAFRGAALGFGNRAATKAIMDAYLVGFAGSVNATLVTFDKPLSKSAKRGGIDYLQLG